MGLFSKFKSKKRSSAKSSSSRSKRRGHKRGKSERVPLATDSLSRKDRKRLAKTMKSFNQQVPILNKLHPKAISASYLNDHLAQYANQMDGAVRLLADNSGDQAYSVLIVSENDLEDAGFVANKKQDPDAYLDLGQLAGQISRNQIVTATSVLDYEHKHLVIVPTADTLDALSEYDEFKNCQFTWGAYPVDSSMGDINQAQVTALSNKVTLAELKEISVKKSDLALNDQDEVAVVSDDEDSSTDNSEAGQAPEDNDANDGGFDPTDALNDGADDNPQPQDNSGNGNIVPPAQVGMPASALNQPDQSAQQGPQPTNNANTTEAMLSGNGVSPITPASPNPQGSMDSSAFGDLMKASGMSSTPETTSNLSLDDIPDDDGNNSNNNGNQSNDVVPPAQSQDEFSANLAETNGAVKTFKETVDDDLNLTIDYSVFDDQSQHRKPIQFLIPKIKDNDRLGQLANQYRRNFNSQLRAANQAQESALREVFESRTRQAASYISQRLNALKGNNSKLAEKDAEIEARYKANMANFEQLWQQKVVDKQRDFEKRKEQVGNAAKEKAIADYEANNRAPFEASLRAERAKEQAAQSSQYINEKADLQRQKVKIAQAAYSATEVRIMKDINKVRQANYEENKAMFEKYEATIQDVLNKNYEAEQNRQIAAAKALEHDNSVEEAKAKVVQIEKEYKEKMRKVQEDADARISKISRISDENVKQAESTYQARIDTLESQLAQTEKNNQMAEEKYRAELMQAKQERQDEIERIVSEHDRANKMSESQFDRARKNFLLIMSLAIVAAVLVGFLLGGFFGKAKSQPQQQPVQQQTTQAPAKSNDNQGGTKIYVNGGESASKDSSSHKITSGDNAGNTHSSSSNSKTSSSAAN